MTACAPGHWSLEGDTDCHECPLGHSCEANGEEPKECYNGTYNSIGFKCRVCPKGYSCLEKDQDPVECPEGTYSLDGDHECHTCPKGTYCVFKD